ncbi:hypothetical protein [Nannocystis punicea]|uniref:Major capsid protein n=1 Tax=Nannocystis punicea TaxID=2995304 RepID=A0ABY7HD55_9BACT|nr:hypothetical protein [Nannocystis poenicansa]WAS97207.1 hypothetical protein O0S08_13750 [Nannocystis poenicansa]
MATLGFNTTTAAKAIHTEQIDPNVIAAPAIVRCYEGVAWQADASQGKADTYKFLSLVAATVSGSQTETEAITATDFGVEDGIATAGVVGRRHFVSRQGLQDAILEQGDIFTDLAEKVRNRVNKDVCALAASAATETDKTGAELTLDNLEEGYATFLALNPNLARHLLIASNAQIAHIRKSIRSSGNGGLIFGAGLDVFNGRPNAAYQGNWGTIEVWRGDMPDDGVSDVAGMFVGADEPGGKSGLGLAVWWAPMPEIQPAPIQVGWEFVVHARYGVCITADHLCHRIVTKKAV